MPQEVTVQMAYRSSCHPKKEIFMMMEEVYFTILGTFIVINMAVNILVNVIGAKATS